MYSINTPKEYSALPDFTYEDILPLNKVERNILDWLMINLHTKKRQFKRKHLWLYGLPNTGKTTLMETLSRYINVYFIPKGDFYYNYDYDTHQLIVFDEYDEHKTNECTKLLVYAGTEPLDTKRKPIPATIIITIRS